MTGEQTKVILILQLFSLYRHVPASDRFVGTRALIYGPLFAVNPSMVFDAYMIF